MGSTSRPSVGRDCKRPYSHQCYQAVLVGALFGCQMLTFGVSHCIGVFQSVFLEEFNHGSGLTSWIGSINQGISCATGPVASWLVLRYGLRFTIAVGALLATTGFVISSTANNLVVIIASFGVLTGVGNGLVYLTSMVALVRHFPGSSRTLVQGIVLSGVGVGTFVYPFVLLSLNEMYGWRGGMLLTAGLTLQLLVAGTVVRTPAADDDCPIPSALESQTETSQWKVREDVLTADSDVVISPISDGMPSTPVYPQRQSLSILSSEICISTNSLAISYKKTCPCNDLPSSQSSYKEQKVFEQSSAPMSPKSNEHNHSCNQILDVCKSQEHHISAPLLTITTLHDVNTDSTNGDEVDVDETSQVTTAQCQFSCRVSFWLVFFSTALLCTGFLIFSTHIVVYAQESCGLAEDQASMLVSIHGLVSIAARIALSLLMMRFHSIVFLLYVICVGLCALMTFLMTLCTSFEGLLICVVVHGMTIIPAYGMILSEVCLRVVGQDHYSYGYGMLMVAMAAGLLIGPPCAGWIYDAMQEYAYSYYLATVSLVLSALCVLPIIIWPQFPWF